MDGAVSGDRALAWSPTMSTAPSVRDERRSERFDVRLSGTIVATDGTRHAAVVRNLSFYGFMAECPLDVVRGDDVVVEMHGRPAVAAKVAWGRDGYMGGAFEAPLTSEELVKLL
jgi:hypothetical protein